MSSQAVLPSTSSFGPAQFKGGGGNNIVMLSLNCNGALASAGNAGNPAASPEGQAAKKLQEPWNGRDTPEGQALCGETAKQNPKAVERSMAMRDARARDSRHSLPVLLTTWKFRAESSRNVELHARMSELETTIADPASQDSANGGDHTSRETDPTPIGT